MTRLNIFLIALLALTALTYVFAANFMVSQKYALASRRAEFNRLNTQLSLENQTSAYNPDLKTLLQFARESGMVESKDADLIMKNGDFALKTNAY